MTDIPIPSGPTNKELIDLAFLSLAMPDTFFGRTDEEYAAGVTLLRGMMGEWPFDQLGYDFTTARPSERSGIAQKWAQAVGLCLGERLAGAVGKAQNPQAQAAKARSYSALCSAVGNQSTAAGACVSSGYSVAAPQQYLTSPRTIAMTGDVEWRVSFDGTSDVTASGTLATVNANVGTFGSSTAVPVITTDAKGRITSVSTAAVSGGGGGSGTVTSVAALTLGTAGTDLSSTVANGTTTPVITLNVPTASATNRGALSAADWSAFNAKQAALVSGTTIKTVGGTSLLGSGDVSVGVTSVSGTGTVSGLSLSGTVTSTGNLTLGGTLAVLPSNFASQTANTVLAAPNGAAGVPTFRSLVAADIPTLNQNTTGTAGNVTGIVAVANGGTGTATPGLVAGTSITVTGTWPNQTIATTAAPSEDVQVFTTSGTWTKPAGAKVVQIIMWGAGGGGGSGRRGASGTVRTGGASGAGGSFNTATYAADLLASTETVTVGAGGAGGAARTTDSTSGVNGTTGGTSVFGSVLRATGGQGGFGGGTAAAGAGSSGVGFYPGGSGSPSGGTGGAGIAGNRGNGISASAGGSAAGVGTANVAAAGAAGGGDPMGRSGVNTTGGGPAAGVSATDRASNDWCGGQGGGGGASSTTGDAQAGGNGAKPGGSGGGGGASTDAVGNSGAGGNGGDGLVVVITTF